MPGETQDFDMGAALADVSGGLFDDNDAGNGQGDSDDADGMGTAVSGAVDSAGAGGPAGAVAGEPGAVGSGEGSGGVDTPDAGSQASAGDGASGASEPADPTLSPPRTWRKEAGAAWATLPPEVRTEIHKREQDIFTGLETYKTDASFGKSVQGALAPYMPTLQQYGIDPVKQVAGLMQAHQTLALGTPEQKQALFTKLAADYGVDLASLSAEPAFIDPAVQALQKDLQTVRSQLSATEAAQRQTAIAEQTRAVETFAADPKNVYFKEVANDMVTLLEKGVATNLQDAYERAIWASPAVRQREIDRLSAERAAAAKKEADEKLAKARAATSANVQTSAKSRSAAAPTGSMDDTLTATLAEIQSRTS